MSGNIKAKSTFELISAHLLYHKNNENIQYFYEWK